MGPPPLYVGNEVSFDTMPLSLGWFGEDVVVGLLNLDKIGLVCIQELLKIC